MNKSKLEASLEDALLGKVKGQAPIIQEPEKNDECSGDEIWRQGLCG